MALSMAEINVSSILLLCQKWIVGCFFDCEKNYNPMLEFWNCRKIRGGYDL